MWTNLAYSSQVFVIILCSSGLCFINLNIKQMLKIWAFFLLVFISWANHNRKPVYTQVTFLYDIKRGDLTNWAMRTFEYYLHYFEQLLHTDSNLIVFGDKHLEEFVWKHRQQHNTVFIIKELESFKSAWYSNLTEEARKGVLRRYGSEHKEAQFTLQNYCNLMFGKLYALTDAIKYDRWNTDFMIWTDAGITHALDRAGSQTNFMKKFYQFVQPQWLYTNANTSRTYMYNTFIDGQVRYAGRKVLGHEQVWANILGGSIHLVRDIKNAFQYVLRLTIENGDIFSDESILAFIPVRYSFLISYSSNIRMDDFYHQHQAYAEIRKNHQIKPRYFHAKIDKKGKAYINAQTEKLDQQKTNKTIAGYIQAIKHDIQAQERLIKPLHFFKKNTDRLILKRKVFFVVVLWILLLAIFCNNRKMGKELALNSQPIYTF